MRTKSQIDKMFAAAALKGGDAVPLTPGHSAAEGAVGAGGDEDAIRRRRERIQHEVDPVDPVDMPEVAHVDLPKAFDQAINVPEGYPAMRLLDAEQFRNRPPTAGRAADSPGWAPPGQPVPIPSTVLAPGAATRPLLADGRSRPCAPEAC